MSHSNVEAEVCQHGSKDDNPAFSQSWLMVNMLPIFPFSFNVLYTTAATLLEHALSKALFKVLYRFLLTECSEQLSEVGTALISQMEKLSHSFLIYSMPSLP